jgi:hypothetical protein
MPADVTQGRVEVDIANTPTSEAEAAEVARVDELTKLLEETGDEEGEDADEASMDDVVEAAPAEDEEPAEPEPEEAAPKPKKKRVRKAKAKEPAPSSVTEPEEPTVPDAAEQARQYYTLRQGQKQVKEAMRMLEQERDTLAKREEQNKELEELGRLMREKPTEAMRELARRGGMSPDAYYEQLTREQLDQPPDANMALAATQRLEKKFEEFLADRKQRDEQREQQGRQALAQQTFQGAVNELLDIQHETYTSNPEARERWGYAMGLPKEELMIEVRAQANSAMQSGVRQFDGEKLGEMMDTINRIAKSRFDAQRQFLDSYQADPEDQDTSEPEQTPEPDSSEGTSPTTGTTPSTVTTHDTATGGVGHREMTEDERWNKIGEKLGDFDL